MPNEPPSFDRVTAARQKISFILTYSIDRQHVQSKCQCTGVLTAGARVHSLFGRLTGTSLLPVFLLWYDES
jgi:hypothetical protein